MSILIIRSSEWLRGGNTKQSYLYDEESNRYCCIGLDGRNEGLSNECMMERTYPSGVARDCSRDLPAAYFARWVRRGEAYEIDYLSTPACTAAAAINDNTTTDDDEKIYALRSIFSQFDIELDWRPEE